MPGGFRQEDIFMFSLYVSNCKKECMARKSHTHKLHTNPRHREEESKNNNSLINSVTSRKMPFQPQNHTLNKLGRVPLGDATYQMSSLLVSDKNVF